jgi:hypothetical protein
MNLRDVSIKFGHVVVVIRYDSSVIWWFKYGLKLVIGTLKIMASTGVFALVICALKHSIS